MAYMIWVTTKCNLRCKYCYEGEKKESYELNNTITKAILDYIYKDFCWKHENELLIEFHGGEPLLNFAEVKHIILEIENKCQHLSVVPVFQITTNATVLNEEMLNFIVQHIQNITVSVDGMRATHNMMRVNANGEGTYDIAMKNSLRLLEKKKNVRARMTVTHQSVGKLYDNIMHLLECGFRIIVPALDFYDLEWKEEDFEIIRQTIRKLRGDTLYNDKCISLLEPIQCFNSHECDGGSTSKNIYPNGDIYPCTMATGKSEFIIGNIYDGIDIKKLNIHRKYSKEVIKECRGCNYIKSCNNNRCKIINKLVRGDYLSPILVECMLNNIRYEENGIA